MTITERIQSDATTAAKAKDRDRLSALRLVLDALNKEAKEARGTLDEQREIAVLKRERKRRTFGFGVLRFAEQAILVGAARKQTGLFVGGAASEGALAEVIHAEQHLVADGLEEICFVQTPGVRLGGTRDDHPGLRARFAVGEHNAEGGFQSKFA